MGSNLCFLVRRNIIDIQDIEKPFLYEVVVVYDFYLYIIDFVFEVPLSFDLL